MKLALAVLSFLTVTTIAYLILSRAGGFRIAVTSAANAISTVQKTAQAR
jgi:hypothetical protein